MSQTINPFNLNHTIIQSAVIHNDNYKEDILPFINAYEFTQSLFSPTIYGSLTINDSNDLLGNKFFNTNGENFVTISIRNVEDIVFEYKFILADIDLEIKGEIADSAIVVVSLISPDFFRNSYMLKSKGYVNLTISEMIKRILKEELNSTIKYQELNDPRESYTEQEATVTFAFTKIRPFEKIEILKNQAFGESDSVASTFLFYETINGYNFISYEHIINNTYSVKNPPNYVYSENMSTEKFRNPLYLGIKSFEATPRNNNLNRVINGMFSSEIYRFDFNTKRITVQQFNLDDDIKKFKNIYNDETINLSYTEQFAKDVRENGKYTYFIPWDSSVGRNDMSYKHFQYSRPFINLLDENTLNIFVDGNLKLNLGDLITTTIWKNKMRFDKSDDYVDNRYSGKYIIQALNNTIYKGEMQGVWYHDTSISLIRDFTPLENVTPNNANNRSGTTQFTRPG